MPSRRSPTSSSMAEYGASSWCDVDGRSPRTWLLLGHKPGDNGQVLALAEALGWPFEIKRMAYRPTELLTNRLFGTTLLGIDRERSSRLEPPWPQLVISAGRRNEPVARWIRKQAGGRDHVKLVHVGRPWAPIETFDLIITTPQYTLPERPNILQNEAPMHRVKQARLGEAGEIWAPRLAHLPRPRIAIMLGGHVGPYTFDAARGAQLGRLVGEMAREKGGSVLISTSARTPPETADACVAAIEAPYHLYRWLRDDPDNPYFGYLALADAVVVTSDSLSMLIEAIASGKPVFIFDLAGEHGGASLQGALERSRSRDRMPTRQLPRLGAVLWRLGRLLGPRRLARDIGVIHRRQVEAGHAAWLGEPWPKTRIGARLQDTERAAERVRALYGQSGSTLTPR